MDNVKLIETLGNHFFRKSDKRAVECCKQLLDEKIINAQELFQIKSNPLNLQYLDNLVLFQMTRFLESNYNAQLFDISKFFTQIEINRLGTAGVVDIESKYLMLKNVQKMSENQWSCLVSVTQLAKLKSKGIIKADANFQRQSIIKRLTADDILKDVYVNWNRVKQIQDLIVQDKYSYNTVRISMINNGTNSPNFITDKNGNVSIRLDINDHLIVPDGNHRVWAATKAYVDNPQMARDGFFDNRFFHVVFTFYTAAETRACIYQEWQTETVSPAHKRSMATNNANKVVALIKANPIAESLYADKISSTLSNCTYGGNIIFTDWFVAVLNATYQPNKRVLDTELKSIADWIVEVFNYITINHLFADLNNISGCRRKNKYSVYPATWASFVYLSYKLQHKHNWKAEIDKIFTTIDWFSPDIALFKVDTRIDFEQISNYYSNKGV